MRALLSLQSLLKYLRKFLFANLNETQPTRPCCTMVSAGVVDGNEERQREGRKHSAQLQLSRPSRSSTESCLQTDLHEFKKATLTEDHASLLMSAVL